MTAEEKRLLARRLELAGIATSSATAQERAAEILQHLERILPFDAGWLAVRDPERHRHVPLATTGAAEPLGDYFGRPEADEAVELLGLNWRTPPMLASEIPSPLAEVRAWADHLLPAGFREGLAAPLFTTAGRHVGFLSLLSADPSRPSRAHREVVAAVTTLIADGLDRTREIAETARIVEDASAGVVLTHGGDVLPLPGLPDHRLLAPGSPILRVAEEELADSGAFVSFLAPEPGSGGEQLARVTALDVARPDLDHLAAAVLVSQWGT
jgi:GAF domain